MTRKNNLNLSCCNSRKDIKVKTFFIALTIAFFLTTFYNAKAQVVNAQTTGFTWVNTEYPISNSFGSGFSLYSAAWPIFKDYPGPQDFQMGLVSSWLFPQPTGNEPPGWFYTTIEGGLGWWHDTSFGTKIPKFIMGGVSYNFYSWANGPGAGKSDYLPNGQRDWSTPGGKYGVAQLSNRLLWAPDGLNMAQSLNGELLGYGYIPLPLTEPMSQTNGVNIATGNQCWTLFLNSTNFKGPTTFFLPTYWTDPVLSNPSLEGLFLDSRPSNPNVGLGIEHAGSPALISDDSNGNYYAKLERLRFPMSSGNTSMILGQFSVYSQNALWNNMLSWFNGGPVVPTQIGSNGTYHVPFVSNEMFARIQGNGIIHDIEVDYMNSLQINPNVMGYEYNLNNISQDEGLFLMPEYFKLESDNKWHAIDEAMVSTSTNLLSTEVPSSPRTEITYLTPLDPECEWQDPNGPWNNPGPVAGPYTANLGDGSTVTYYWYLFKDQPAIIQANLPENLRNQMQIRAELIHSNWSHTDEYLEPPIFGKTITLDPAGIVTPPPGLEIGYVPIVTRQGLTPPKVRVFILAGQSNMQGYGTVVDPQGDPGSLIDVIQNDVNGDWSEIGGANNWNTLNNAYLYYDDGGPIIKANVTVGQGANDNSIGPELMFAHQLDEYYDDPVLIIKTAWGGNSLAVNFRPPSAGGTTGEAYNNMIQIVQDVTQNLLTEFPGIGLSDFEITGFAWFQGWNDGGDPNYYNEYESNLNHLINDVRVSLNVPNLPIVIANSGQGGFDNTNDGWVSNIQNIIAVAQENVGCNDVLYGGKVGFVETKQYYIDAINSPEDAIYHYNNNALTYLNIGKDMGEEMILAINEMAFCYGDCTPVLSQSLSIGNRVWNDLDLDGINDPEEPGIPGVTLVLWGDSDGDDIPDYLAFGGLAVTNNEGYYKFSGLQPGNYVVFVWDVANWDLGGPLHGFLSTNNFVANADNDIDNDNNGYGLSDTSITSGIVNLAIGQEPLNDDNLWNCYFDSDPSTNNTVDFGFYDPNVLGIEDVNKDLNFVVFPNPAHNELTIKTDINFYQIQILDVLGRIHQTIESDQSTSTLDISKLANGLYFIKILNESNRVLKIQKIIKK